MSYVVPFNRPFTTGDEFAYMQQAIERAHTSGVGPFTRACEAALGELTGSPTLLTTSCTHALEMAGMLYDLGPDDEVIVPSFTFVSTANAFARTGARIRFADICPDTFALEPASAGARRSEHTRAAVPVHYGGVPADISGLRDAVGSGVAIIEDNAHGLGATVDGRPLGTEGDVSTYSFHETKNLHCGEGGALVVNDAALVARAEILREKGTNRSAFFRGQVDKYTWVDTGSSYVLSDLLAAFLLAQLEHADDILARRRTLWARYREELTDWATRTGARFQHVPEGVTHSAHVFPIVMPEPADQTSLLEHLDDAGVNATFHYVPLHSSPVGRQLDPEACCPVTESVSERLVRLPLFAGLTDREQRHVIEAVRRWPARSA